MPTVQEALQHGWKLHQAGQVDDAAHIYRQVLEQVPKNPEALVYLGIALFDLHQYDKSAESYRKALKIRDDFPIAWNNLGNSLRLLGQIDEAETCFEKHSRKIQTTSPHSKTEARFGSGRVISSAG